MMRWRLFGSIAALLFAYPILAAEAGDANDSEHVRITHSSRAFESSFAESMDLLSRLGFEKGLRSQALNARSNDEFESLVKLVNEQRPVPIAEMGSPDVEYDVILQPGHYLRKHKYTGGQGALVSERQLVAYVVENMADNLRARSLSVLVVSADGYYHADGPRRLKTKVFLALHTDGTDKVDRKCTIPPSLAYKKAYTVAMHTIGASLARALGKDYDQFRHNYTANEARYYMFNQVDSTYLTGLLELGELSCVKDERDLIDAVDVVSGNLSQGVATIIQGGQLNLLGSMSSSRNGK